MILLWYHEVFSGWQHHQPCRHTLVLRAWKNPHDIVILSFVRSKGSGYMWTQTRILRKTTTKYQCIAIWIRMGYYKLKKVVSNEYLMKEGTFDPKKKYLFPRLFSFDYRTLMSFFPIRIFKKSELQILKV